MSPPNPSAFPGLQRTDGYGCARRSPDGGSWETWDPGLTLFDYHAARAPEMPSWFVRETYTDRTPHTPIVRLEDDLAHLIRWRHAYALAMLSERAKHFPST